MIKWEIRNVIEKVTVEVVANKALAYVTAYFDGDISKERLVSDMDALHTTTGELLNYLNWPDEEEGGRAND